MAKSKKTVRFITSASPYNTGERATFDLAEADDLIKRGVAVTESEYQKRMEAYEERKRQAKDANKARAESLRRRVEAAKQREAEEVAIKSKKRGVLDALRSGLRSPSVDKAAKDVAKKAEEPEA